MSMCESLDAAVLDESIPRGITDSEVVLTMVDELFGIRGFYVFREDPESVPLREPFADTAVAASAEHLVICGNQPIGSSRYRAIPLAPAATSGTTILAAESLDRHPGSSRRQETGPAPTAKLARVRSALEPRNSLQYRIAS